MSSLFHECSNASDGDLAGTLECVAEAVDNERQNSIVISSDEVYTWLKLLCGALVFFMQAGFAMVCAGAVRKKNTSNTMMKNLLDACGAAVAFYSFGYGLAYGETAPYKHTMIGINQFFLRGEDVDFADFFFQYAFGTAAVTIVASTLAERCTMTAYVFYSFVLMGFVYPVVVHAVWTSTGYLTNIFGTSMIDFAGSGVVHMTGGMTALIASVILGPRKGRFYESNGVERVGLQKGSSVSLQMLGTFILWFGWYGFNAGSAIALGTSERSAVAGLAAVTTTISAACGCLGALSVQSIMGFYKSREFHLDINAAMNGCLSGLVAITAGCGVVEPLTSLFIGLISGIFYLASKHLLLVYKVDDAVDAIPVHLVNGIWGVLSTGLLASPRRLVFAYGDGGSPGWFYSFSNGKLLLAQIVGILAILLWVIATMFPFFKLLDKAGYFRVSEMDELIGLGISYHNHFFSFYSSISFSDATYEGGEVPERLFDDDRSVSDKEERLKAYQKRFQEKKIANSRHNSMMGEFANKSWHNLDLTAVGQEPIGEIWQDQELVLSDNSSSIDGGEWTV